MKRFFLNRTIINTLVVLNTIIIFISGFQSGDFVLYYIDDIFTLVFVVEAVVKIRAWSWEGYWRNSWNRFDFIILLLSLPSLSNIIGVDTLPTNVVLTFRVLRVLKAMRLMKYIPHIEGLLRGFEVAMRSSLLVCVVFLTFLLVTSILTTAIFGRISPDAFGNPGISLYSMFRLFTIEGWYDLPDQIAHHGDVTIGVFARIYFSVLLFIGGIIGMSLINSIFVDAMAQDNNDDLKKELKELKEQLDRMEEKLESKK